MNNCIKEALEDFIETVDESDEFKRHFKKFIENQFEGSAAKDDLRDLIGLIKIVKADKEEID